MEFDFYGIHFNIQNDILAASIFGSPLSNLSVTDVRMAGMNICSHSPAKQILAESDAFLRFENYEITDKKLTVRQKNNFIRTETVFEKCGGGLKIFTIVKNLSEKEIVLENVTIFNLSGFDAAGKKNTYLYRFHNSHQCECQPRKTSLDKLGLFETGHRSYKRISGFNAGSWSCKEELPQAILTDGTNYFMFQIESCGGWYWEIAEGAEGRAYLSLSGGNFPFTGWTKRLNVGEEYVSRSVAVCIGNGLDSVLQKMTAYRRSTACFGSADLDLPIVFNEYMHLSWDSPEESRTHELVSIAAKYGVDIYVIDCGWHDEVDGSKIHPYVGKWRESKARFPHGLKNMTDYIRACGMKAGLWIEPEVLGTLSGEEYPEEAYIHANGQRVCVSGRYFLDFRHGEVRRRLDDTIERMINEYGAEYIKIDCNQDCGPGTEIDSNSLGDGLEKTTDAFWNWLNTQRAKFPTVIFESCASGGMRVDWKSLQVSSIMSTSDQVLYTNYPYIVSNIFSAVLPEQAGFWSYPIIDPTYLGSEHIPSDNEIVMNMVNVMLGRMHLASDLRKLTSVQKALVEEGIEYIKGINKLKYNALPVLPFGFAEFGDDKAAVGLEVGSFILLAIWNLGEEKEFFVPLENYNLKKVTTEYPKNTRIKAILFQNKVKVVMEKSSAVLLKVEI